eukprot:PhF_6_TR1741/c0_g1_i1/m.2918
MDIHQRNACSILLTITEVVSWICLQDCACDRINYNTISNDKMKVFMSIDPSMTKMVLDYSYSALHLTAEEGHDACYVNDDMTDGSLRTATKRGREQNGRSNK